MGLYHNGQCCTSQPDLRSQESPSPWSCQSTDLRRGSQRGSYLFWKSALCISALADLSVTTHSSMLGSIAVVSHPSQRHLSVLLELDLTFHSKLTISDCFPIQAQLKSTRQSHETPFQPLSFDFALSTPFLHACMFYPHCVIVFMIHCFGINNNVVILYKNCLVLINR